MGVRVHCSDGVVYNLRTGLLGVRVRWSDGVVYNSTTVLLSAKSAKDVWKSTTGLLRTHRSGGVVWKSTTGLLVAHWSECVRGVVDRFDPSSIDGSVHTIMLLEYVLPGAAAAVSRDSHYLSLS